MTPEQRAEIRARADDRPFPLRPFLTHDQVQLLHRLAADVPALLVALDEADAENERLTALLGRLASEVRRLEQENAAALALHRNKWNGFCIRCQDRWPCDTAVELGVEP